MRIRRQPPWQVPYICPVVQLSGWTMYITIAWHGTICLFGIFSHIQSCIMLTLCLNRMLRVSLLVVVVLGCLLTSSVCRAQVFYVKPSQSQNTTCPGKIEPCHTLNYYAQNAASLLSGKSNVTLVFVGGVHLFTEPNFEIANTTNVTLMGISIQAPPSVKFSAGQFNLTMIDKLVISHLTFLYDSVNCSESEYEPTVFSVSQIRRFSQNHIQSTCIFWMLEMTSQFQLYKNNSTYKYGKVAYTDQTIINNTHRSDSISMSIHHCSFVSSELSIYLNSASNTTFNGTISSSYGVSIYTVIASPGFTVYITVNDCHEFSSGGGRTMINIWLAVMINKFELRVQDSKTQSIILTSSQIQKNAMIGISNSSFFGGQIQCTNVTNVALSQLSLNRCSIFLLTKKCRLENVNVSNSPPVYIGGPSTVNIDGCVFENGTDFGDLIYSH